MEEKVCGICLDGGGDDLDETFCGHTFHETCFYGWVNHGRGNDSCPTCRRPVNPQIARSNMQNFEYIASNVMKDFKRIGEITYSIRRSVHRSSTVVLTRKGLPLHALKREYIDEFGVTADTVLSITVPVEDESERRIFYNIALGGESWIRTEILDGNIAKIDMTLG